MKLHAGILAALVVVVACGEDASGPAYAPFSGEWRGSLTGAVMRIEITDEDGEVGGAGTLQIGANMLAIEVAGEHRHPRVEFTGHAANFESFDFTGRFESRDTVAGKVDGSGFTNARLVLIRQYD